MAVSVDTILRLGAPVLGLTAVPIAMMTARTLRQKPTEEELTELESEKVKRAQRVAENVEILKGVEEMEEKQKKEKGDTAKAKSDKSLGEDEEEEDDDAEGTITLENHGQKVEELASISPNAVELEEGLVWVGKLALKELQMAVVKTREQKKQQYSDGSKLQDMLDYYPYRLSHFDTLSKYKIPRKYIDEVRQEEHKGWKVRRTQQWKGVFKGMSIIAQARECVPWVAASMGVSAVRSYIRTSAQIYQAMVMDAVIRKNGAEFKMNAKATVIVEIFNAMVGVLERQLNQASQAQVSESLCIKLCSSLLSKDMTFWREVKDPYSFIGKLFGLPYEIRNALEAPQQLITQAVSIVTMMFELRRKSGSMYKILAVLQIAQILVRKLIDTLNERCHRYLMAKVISPSRDQFSFFLALTPEYSQMFQAFARTKKEVKSYSQFAKANQRREALSNVAGAVMEPVNTITEQGTRIGEYNTILGLLGSGEVNFNEAQNLLSYAAQTASNLQEGYRQIKDLGSTMDPLAAAYDIINIPAKIDLSKGVTPEDRAKGHFVFDNVTFRYPGKIGNSLLLKGVSFEVQTGQIVGITGSSGCGKSTILRLIERFYDVTEGRIMLDGLNIREYNPEWLRSQIVTVEQEPRLLGHQTIRQNLVFGCSKEPTTEEIQQACESAQIWDTLNDKDKFPEFLETRLPPGSSTVSGGEKQRICIARAILANPSILLLDEATSALDELSQHKVQEALNNLMNGRTTLCVTHRLSTIKDSQKIIALEEGVVVDDGTHQQLIAKKDSEPNVYKKLWKMQGIDDSHAVPIEPEPLKHQTTRGKFEVLRTALAASLPKEKADAMITLVNDLEQGGASDDEFKAHLEAAELHPSRWSKLRGLVATGRLKNDSPAILESLKSSPQLVRQPSLAAEATAKLTRALSQGTPKAPRQVLSY